MADTYRLVYTGFLREGVDRDQAVADLAKAFKFSEEKARAFVDHDGDLKVKEGIDLEEAEKYQRALSKMGLVMRIEAMGQPEQPVPTPVTAADDHGLVEVEETPSPSGAATPEANPYAAPQADLRVDTSDGELGDPRGVPAGNSWLWISRGMSMFRQNMGAWILAMLVYFVINFVLSLVPFIGSLATNLLAAVFAGGLMIGAHEQHKGGEFKFEHLFAGFSNNTGQLVLLGVLFLVVFIVLGIVLAFAGGGTAFLAMGSGSNDAGAFAMGTLAVIGVLFLLVMIPVAMGYWFAPVLIALHGVSAIVAIKMSFSACLRNILPLLLFMVMAAVGVFLGAIALFVGLLFVMPVLFAAVYASYRDIFLSDTPQG